MAEFLKIIQRGGVGGGFITIYLPNPSKSSTAFCFYSESYKKYSHISHNFIFISLHDEILLNIYYRLFMAD